ncbi:DddA-like double-stranded DNA deaminase toxin [Streptomyces fradiae]|uniref:DddA-like double-stranded DNA deaminase toxin n=1 Tax=Streptomyces fradiae TaxID=1906 RepID=UPI003808CB7B
MSAGWPAAVRGGRRRRVAWRAAARARVGGLAANHVHQVERLIAEGSLVAAKARVDYWRAAEAAAKAKQASAEATTAAAEAQKSADAAAKFAADAKGSADAAAQSAADAAASATTARNAADAAAQDAAAAENSAAEAEFSASYARASAQRANDAADQARASALAAGHSAIVAEAEAKAAWTATRALAEQEAEEARRQAAEERKRQQEAKPKRVCVPHPVRESMTPIMPCALSPGDSMIVMPDIDPTMKAIVWELAGINDIKACIDNPTALSCVMAAVGVTPWGKLKLVTKIDDGIDGIRALRSTRRTIACLTQDEPHSFPAGTKVLMADGTRRPIEQAQTGDLVTATDPTTGETGSRIVTRTIHTPDDRYFTGVTLTDGSTLTSTSHHPYWSENDRSWKNASDLKAGDTLRTPQNTTVAIVDTRNWQGLQDAYDLTVEDLHTYYVSTGTTNVLVHNTNTDCPVWVSNLLKQLPEWSDGDKTVGRLRGPDGKDLATLPKDLQEVISGEVLRDGTPDPWYVKANKYIYTSDHPDFPKPAKVPKYPPASHVESKYAAWMAESGISEATLVINNNKGVCNKRLNCKIAIEAILPDGHTLNVYYPGAKEPVPLVGKRKKPLP